jgi:uncharacterized iron-regulated membrane protein
MNLKMASRKIHRWLGLLMALQIVAWMASGLWFSIFPIEEIRGEHLTRPAEGLELARLGQLAAPAVVQGALDQHFDESWQLAALELRRLDGQLYWRVSGSSGQQTFTRLVAAEEGRVAPMLTAAAAESRARDWLLTPAEPEAVEWVESVAPDGEIRGRELPVWKVSFSQPESLNLYLDPWTGEILARRTARWRVFDFFWMLHIMDFDTRDDFNHPLLQVAAALGLVIALSGILLWVLTTRLLRNGGAQGSQDLVTGAGPSRRESHRA